MKFSYNWLKELSETEKNVDELAELLLTHSFEVEGVEDLSEGFENLVVGEVLEIRKHSNADKLNISIVDVGEKEPRQIIFGQMAKIEVGIKTIVALAPAVLSDGKEIKVSKLRGELSEGMLCLDQEIGIAKEGATITTFDATVKNGTPIKEILGLDDCVMEIDILPNRGHDALSYIGMANEIRTLEDRPIITAEEKKVDTSTGASMDVRIDTEKCSRYIGIKIDGITIGESPEWIKAKLRASDIQPISNIVDITNYVMLETGQPLHAFDAKKVTSIGVRQAKDGEKITLLDDAELELDVQDIAITDGKKAIALAGVMGGEESGISSTTTSIILEAASFDATSVRFTQRKYNLQTDAAYRFERKIDPNLAEAAAAKAMQMVIEICGGSVIAQSDSYPYTLDPWTVEISVERVAKLLGVNVEKDVIVDIVNRLGADVEDGACDDALIITPPTVRLDLATQEDMIEEIGRIYGYDKIEKKPLKDKVQAPVRNEERFFERTLKDVFVYGGFDEVRGYSFYAFDDARALGLNDEKHIALLNPMNPEQAIMRRTLAAAQLHFAKKNMSYFDRVQIFEIGRIYDPTESALPDERLMVAASVTSKDTNGAQFYDMKGMIESLLDRVGVARYIFSDDFSSVATHAPELHPSRRAKIMTESGDVIGWIGEVNKKAHKHFGLKRARTAVCEIDVTVLRRVINCESNFTPLARYPHVTRDLSMIVGTNVRVADVERVLYDAGGDLVIEIDLFDLYENTEKNERSMAFRIVFGADDRTLEASEVDVAIDQMITRIEESVDAEVRK